MKKLHLITSVGVESDLAYLPHFLKHYTDLGIQPANIHVLLQTVDEKSKRLIEANEILADWQVPPGREWIAPYTSRTMWDERRRLQQDRVDHKDFVLSADVDEFHEYPAELEDIVSWCESEGYDVVQGPFIDRIANDLTLRPVPGLETSIQSAFPLQTELRHAIAGLTENVNLGGSVKAMLFKGDILPGLGGHGVLPEQRNRPHALGNHLPELRGLEDPKQRFALPFLVHHYKWTEGLESRMRKRLATPGITQAGREYGEALLKFFDGSSDIGAVDLAFRDPEKYDHADWKVRVAEIRDVLSKKKQRSFPSRIVKRIRSLVRAR